MLSAAVFVSSILVVVHSGSGTGNKPGGHQSPTAGVIEIATRVFNENFAHTIVGDCDFLIREPDKNAKILRFCPRVMNSNGCTMGQMFLGIPEKCQGLMPNLGNLPYEEIWKKYAAMTVHGARTVAYKQKELNEAILEAGNVALSTAKAKAKTNNVAYGVGVCTSLAAAGQTAIANVMNDPKQNGKWAGYRIKIVKKTIGTDGHEYIVITDFNDENPVIVDYWYAAKAAKDGAAKNIVAWNSEDQAAVKRWDLDKATVAKDGTKANRELIFEVQQGSSAHRLVDNEFSYYDLLYDEAADRLLEAEEEFEMAQQMRRVANVDRKRANWRKRLHSKRHTSRWSH